MKTLLLNSSYETISFIGFRKLIKLIIKQKVDIVSTWDEEINWVSGKIKLPAVVRMTYYVPRARIRSKFNRVGVFRRDLYQCLYCGIAVTPSKITLDHILPTSLGGESTWLNAASACTDCNARKANKTPEQAGMRLLHQPTIPEITLTTEYILMQPQHPSWADYFSDVERVKRKTHIILPVE